jgi:hypothetical protein
MDESWRYTILNICFFSRSPIGEFGFWGAFLPIAFAASTLFSHFFIASSYMIVFSVNFSFFLVFV